MVKSGKNTPDWKRMCFKENKVWVQTDSSGNLMVKNGKVLIKYQLKQDYEYQVLQSNLKPLDHCNKKNQGDKKGNQTKRKAKKKPKSSKDSNQPIIPENAISIYTDGASSGNPGPSGIGVLLKFQNHEKSISKYIGEATNNIAELEAIRVGLMEVKKKNIPVRIFTDSSYALGLLTLGWTPKKNKDLVKNIKNIMADFKDLRFIKVKGHSDDKNNELADKLATSAIKN